MHASGASDEPAEEVEVHVLVGSPGDEIIRFVHEQDVDLVVISMQRPAMTFGGAADLVEFIAARAPCPVLSVNEVGKTYINVAKSKRLFWIWMLGCASDMSASSPLLFRPVALLRTSKGMDESIRHLISLAISPQSQTASKAPAASTYEEEPPALCRCG